MEKGRSSSPVLADIWGDTVDLRHLGGALIIGAVLGFAFFKGGLTVIKGQYPAIQPSLQNALALLVGIVGCLLAAVISAKLFPPKRALSEQSLSEEERRKVLEELQLDLAQEARDMKTLPPEIQAEMKELRLDAVFTAPPSPSSFAPKTES